MDEYQAYPKFYYVRDSFGVPDGRKKLRSVHCSCGQKMHLVSSYPVDCGTELYLECPDKHTGYSFLDVIQEC